MLAAYFRTSKTTTIAHSLLSFGLFSSFARSIAKHRNNFCSNQGECSNMNSNIASFKQIMDNVYGPYTSDWQPVSFEEAKSRYLWTDAYGVCNYLTLYKETGQEEFLSQAKILVATVHNILGRTRDGSKRLGNSTDDHPLNGGLRIGKPSGEGSGMSHDGQYYHYLTKWMFALNRMTWITKEPQYNQWAIELVQAVHAQFCTSDKHKMYWKMSIDLSHPLVTSEGGLDTYDGLTMYMLLQDTAKIFDKFDHLSADERKKWEDTHLKPEIDHMKSLVAARYKRYATHDTLDAGEALWLAHFFPELDYSKHLRNEAGNAVEKLWKHGEFDGPSSSRLAFREFGTTIGVQMHPDLWVKWEPRVEGLHEFWFKHLQSRDNDITPIMYCTSLIPGVFQASYM